ncbi:DUF5994 family protein [Mycobacterium sp. CVI_P3]|uniref:DUF5994 family protein n=1 Tax=Mycobacterium pinniadriaticum TaxID=2994102 RepID=A0ABT3SKS6_9MYCO|nr:DUF5994 family protein [Mycobacterium pinniadriaticum]MCX2933527.1 DUF5994 family protein [Mycobacterium pinniadriaticum]MCX2939972.1 DUF5994 family protein [Mycobacterium pinniadriaticum]
MRNANGAIRYGSSFPVNGMRGPRRTASPVRLTLNSLLGGDIDGAWWPRTGSLASELPDLIDALHVSLGEVVDININWSATAAAPILDAHFANAMRSMRWNDSRQRIMVVVGREACARLLVIPHTTTQALGWMVMRHAATMQVVDEDRDVPEYAVADQVVRAAREQSAASARTLDAPAAEAPKD